MGLTFEEFINDAEAERRFWLVCFGLGIHPIAIESVLREAFPQAADNPKVAFTLADECFRVYLSKEGRERAGRDACGDDFEGGAA